MSACAAPIARPTPFPCSDSIGCIKVGPNEPLHLAGLYTLSGGAAPAGIEQDRAARLAISLRGDRLLGHPIQIQVEDEHCSPEGGANAALRVVTDPQLIAVIGTSCSSAAATAMEIFSENGLVMISSENTSPFLTSIDGQAGPNWYPGYFRTSWNDTDTGRAAASFARHKLRASKAVLVNSGDIYTQGLTEVFRRNFTALGGEVVLSILIDESESDQAQTLNAVELSDAQVVFISLNHPEAGSRLIRQANNYVNLKNTHFIVDENMFSDVFLQQADQAGKGLYIVGPNMPVSDADNQFRAAYRRVYGEDPQAYFYRYTADAVNLLLDSIEKTSVVMEDGSLYIGRQALRNQLYQTSGYEGITGRLQCDSFGDCGAVHLQIAEYRPPLNRLKDLQSHIVYEYPEP